MAALIPHLVPTAETPPANGFVYVFTDTSVDKVTLANLGVAIYDVFSEDDGLLFPSGHKLYVQAEAPLVPGAGDLWLKTEASGSIADYFVYYEDAWKTFKAPLHSPAFTGNPTAPTPAAEDASQRLATTAFVTNKTAQLSVAINNLNESIEDLSETLAGLIDDTTVEIDYPENRVYTLTYKSSYRFKVLSLDIIAGAGTGSAALTINNLGVTGISNVAISTVNVTASATAANIVEINDRLNLVLSGTNNLEELIATIKIQRL